MLLVYLSILSFSPSLSHTHSRSKRTGIHLSVPNPLSLNTNPTLHTLQNYKISLLCKTFDNGSTVFNDSFLLLPSSQCVSSAPVPFTDTLSPALFPTSLRNLALLCYVSVCLLPAAQYPSTGLPVSSKPLSHPQPLSNWFPERQKEKENMFLCSRCSSTLNIRLVDKLI